MGIQRSADRKIKMEDVNQLNLMIMENKRLQKVTQECLSQGRLMRNPVKTGNHEFERKNSMFTKPSEQST
jgi:hypothetical protein